MDDARLVSRFREITAVAVPKNARILPSPTPLRAGANLGPGRILNVLTSWEQRNLDRGEYTRTTRTFAVLHGQEPATGRDTLDVITASPAVTASKGELSAYNEDSSKQAIITKVNGKHGDEKWMLEIWSDGIQVKCIDLSEKKQHLQVYTDGQFGSLEFSPDGERLLYVAEKYYKTESYFKKPASDDEVTSPDGSSKKEAASVIYGEQNVFRQDWGEGLKGKYHPVICVIDLVKEKVSVLPALPENVSCGQATWAKDGNSILFVGWENEPYRLGITYCENRKSSLYQYNVNNDTCTRISNKTVGVSCPRFTPDGNVLIYRTHVVNGPHRQTQQLVKCAWPLIEAVTVVPVVRRQETPDAFPGLYTDTPPSRCWASEKRFIFTTVWRSQDVLAVLNVETGSIQRLDTSESTHYTWNLLDVFDDIIVATRAAPNVKPHLVIGCLPTTGHESAIKWTTFQPVVSVPEITYKTLTFKPLASVVHPDYSDVDFEAILLTPILPDVKQSTLIVVPHGGPHSAHTAGYSVTSHYLVSLGFSLLLVNYRGSIGFGADHLSSLLGHIGEYDVQDVHQASQHVMSNDPNIKQALLMGGSHGGFLALNLVSQFPDFYKACVARNPVVDLPVMLGTSDIPDWIYVEAGLDYSQDVIPTLEAYGTFWAASPFRHAHQITAPVLLHLGKNDNRVPMHQGLQLFKLLKARGKQVQAYVYDDKHSLAKVDVEADCVIHAAKFFLSAAPPL